MSFIDFFVHSFGDSSHAYKTALKMTNSSNGLTEFTYTYTMVAHDQGYDEGYCYQFRPASLLPVRIDPSTVSIIKNEGHKCEITDNRAIVSLSQSPPAGVHRGAVKGIHGDVTHLKVVIE
jgi:hypothetical protein